MGLGARRRASCFFAEDHSSVNIGHSKKHEAPCTVTETLAKKQEPPWQQNEVSAKLLEPFHRVRWRMFFCRGDRALSPCLLLFCKRLFGRTRAVRFFSSTLAPVHQGPAKNQATLCHGNQARVFGDRRRRVARRRPIFCKRLRRQEDRVPPFARPWWPSHGGGRQNARRLHPGRTLLAERRPPRQALQGALFFRARKKL